LLQQLSHLTYLELVNMTPQGPDAASPALQPLQALTRLADLRFGDLYPLRQDVTAGMLSGMCHLTRLLVKSAAFEPAALANKAKLQHLQLAGCIWQPPAGAAGWMALLSHLHHLMQLTYLDIRYSAGALRDRSLPPAATYAALTASSNLQHLDMGGCTLSVGVWQHLFPADRQLLQLTSLGIARVQQLPHDAAPAPEGSRLVSSCPSLQSLSISSLLYNPQQLTQLQGLTGLHTLHLVTGTGPRMAHDASADTGDTLQAVCQLTGLRELGLYVIDAATQMLITQLQQLLQLPHLTSLQYDTREGPRKELKQAVSCTLWGGASCLKVRAWPHSPCAETCHRGSQCAASQLCLLDSLSSQIAPLLFGVSAYMTSVVHSSSDWQSGRC
jgi:hypothetical protein